ncbi:MAG TPA: glycosyltransferase, partial [Isosphaeraceae bacterium]|nr:glycosyltransferase [Isosphaeraceae bacterium]
MSLSTVLSDVEKVSARSAPTARGTVAVACPDARPPAYQAAVGLARAGLLRSFHTAFYYGGTGPLSALERFGRLERVLRRRHHPEIPPSRVRARWEFDLSLAVENCLAGRWPRTRRGFARRRTDRFDRALERSLERERPEVAFVFSDVGSAHALPACRRLGIASILSMVHGDVREEQHVLAHEAECSPDFLPIYLGDGVVDHDELAWLHERRLRDIALADRILVPSEHIAETLVAHGTMREAIRVVPYAADAQRFVPDPHRPHGPSCTFLFAGGITQRKG